MKEVEDIITSKTTYTDKTDNTSSSGKTDISDLISELTKIKEDGNTL